MPAFDVGFERSAAALPCAGRLMKAAALLRSSVGSCGGSIEGLAGCGVVRWRRGAGLRPAVVAPLWICAMAYSASDGGAPAALHKLRAASPPFECSACFIIKAARVWSFAGVSGGAFAEGPVWPLRRLMT